MTTPRELAEPKYSDAEIEAMIDRLSNSTPNWYRESFGDWKDAVHTCDRAPKDAADMLRSLLASRPSTPDKAGVSDAVELCIFAVLGSRFAEGGNLQWSAKDVETLRSDMRAALTHFTQSQSAEAVRDGERLDALDTLSTSYGFQDVHEGNRWTIEGPFANIRRAADALIEHKEQSHD